jgi:hypothetical protein
MEYIMEGSKVFPYCLKDGAKYENVVKSCQKDQNAVEDAEKRHQKKLDSNGIHILICEFLTSYYSNVAEEEIAKQFPTERREMIFCAIPMTEKWPFFCI